MPHAIRLLASASLDDDIVHVLLTGFSLLVLAVSVAAYRRRGETRYLFLVLAFAFLSVAEIVTTLEALLLSNSLILIPLVNLHLSHFLDLMMLVCFGLALMRSRRGRGDVA